MKRSKAREKAKQILTYLSEKTEIDTCGLFWEELEEMLTEILVSDTLTKEEQQIERFNELDQEAINRYLDKTDFFAEEWLSKEEAKEYRKLHNFLSR